MTVIYFLPVELNNVSTFTPKLVASSIGWMASVKEISDMARAAIKISVTLVCARREYLTSSTVQFNISDPTT